MKTKEQVMELLEEKEKELTKHFMLKETARNQDTYDIHCMACVSASAALGAYQNVLEIED